MRCQNLHAERLMSMDARMPRVHGWTGAAKIGGGVVIDPTHNEKTAMQAVLPHLGEYVASVGMDKPLSAYSREEILQMVDLVLTAFFDNLRELTPDDVPF
jgi:hypothetical protein